MLTILDHLSQVLDWLQRRHKMRESSFQSSALKYLNSLNKCCAENVSGNPQQSGRPDINGVYKGRSFRIELKIIGYKPTMKQMINLLRWFESGSAICVAYNIWDVQDFISGFLHETPWEHKYENNCYCAFGYYRKGAYTNEFFKQYKQLFVQD